MDETSISLRIRPFKEPFRRLEAGRGAFLQGYFCRVCLTSATIRTTSGILDRQRLAMGKDSRWEADGCQDPMRQSGTSERQLPESWSTLGALARLMLSSRSARGSFALASYLSLVTIVHYAVRETIALQTYVFAETTEFDVDPNS